MNITEMKCEVILNFVFRYYSLMFIFLFVISGSPLPEFLFVRSFLRVIANSIRYENSYHRGIDYNKIQHCCELELLSSIDPVCRFAISFYLVQIKQSYIGYIHEKHATNILEYYRINQAYTSKRNESVDLLNFQWSISV